MAGPLRSLTVKDVQVENCFNGLVVIGDVQDVTLANNVLRDTGVGVILRDAEGTVLAGGRVTDNLVEDENAVGVLIERWGDGVSDILVANNRVLDSTEYPIVLFWPTSDLLVEDNTFDGGFAAALLLGSVSNVLVTRNCVRNGGLQGIPEFAGGGIQVGLFGIPGSGFEIADNSYENNVAWPAFDPRDVWLTGSASNNTVLEEPGVVVVNDGANNTVGAIPNDGVNYCGDA